MFSKLIYLITLIWLASLNATLVEADVSDNHAHLRVIQLVNDVEAVSVTLEDGRAVLTNLTPGTVSEFMLYFVNRSTFLTLGITPINGASIVRQWAIPPLPPGYYSAVLVGNSADNTLDLIFIDEDELCESQLAVGSCLIVVNNIEGSPPLTFTINNLPVIDATQYRHAVINLVAAGSYVDFIGIELLRPEAEIFQLQRGFFEPNVIYFYGLTGSYPGAMFLDYTLGVTRRVPVDMMTFLRGLTADLQLTNDDETLIATENIVAILEQAGFDALVSNPQQALTVFAPTDGAVLDVPVEVFSCATSNPLAMRALILNHLLVGKLTSADLIQSGLVQTLAGTAHTFIQVEGGFFIDSQVRVSDALAYPALNGNLYLIDAVLVPDGFVEQYCGAG